MLPAPPKLSPKERELFDLLWLFRGSYVTTDRAMQWCYGHLEDPPFDEVISCRIHAMRKKLKGWAIRVHNGRGWWLEKLA